MLACLALLPFVLRAFALYTTLKVVFLYVYNNAKSKPSHKQRIPKKKKKRNKKKEQKGGMFWQLTIMVVEEG